MKFRPFHLFYILTILLIAIGIATKNSLETVAPGWHTVIYPDFMYFFLPAALWSLMAGLIYQYWNSKGKPVKTKIVLLHFALTVIGLALSVNLFIIIKIILSDNAPDALSLGSSAKALYFVIIGPLLLLIAAIVFVIGMVKAKKIG